MFYLQSIFSRFATCVFALYIVCICIIRRIYCLFACTHVDSHGRYDSMAPWSYWNIDSGVWLACHTSLWLCLIKRSKLICWNGNTKIITRNYVHIQSFAEGLIEWDSFFQALPLTSQHLRDVWHQHDSCHLFFAQLWRESQSSSLVVTAFTFKGAIGGGLIHTFRCARHCARFGILRHMELTMPHKFTANF